MTPPDIRAIASVIIPAHNESAVIGRCLQAMTSDMRPGALEIIVVCNGCTDRTEEIARSFGDEVTVIHTDKPNKPHALNLGDAQAKAFPRFYIDADVIVSFTSIQRVTNSLNTKPIMLASPRSEILLRDCSPLVQAFFVIWKLLPYYRDNFIGGGVYALNQAGRSCFDTFPNLLAEDEYIRLSIDTNQHEVVKAAWFRTKPPKTLRALLKIRARQQRGLYQFKALNAHMLQDENRHYWRYVRVILRRARYWTPLLVYAMVTSVSRIMGWLQYRTMSNPMRWDRDEAARSTTT